MDNGQFFSSLLVSFGEQRSSAQSLRADPAFAEILSWTWNPAAGNRPPRERVMAASQPERRAERSCYVAVRNFVR